MNTQNARLTFARRLEMTQAVVDRGHKHAAAAAAFGVSLPTVGKWAARYRAEGEMGLRDRCSRPSVSPRAISRHGCNSASSLGHTGAARNQANF